VEGSKKYLPLFLNVYGLGPGYRILSCPSSQPGGLFGGIMRRTSLFLIAAALLVAAFPAQATPKIMQENKKTKCTDCHASLPGSKANLNDEGKKHIPAKK
jgi:hypothetical protein